MKTPLLTISLSLALAFSACADSSLILNGVHNCCKKCDTGISDAVAKVAGATAQVEKNKVTITAKDDATTKQAMASLVAAGYYGEGATAPEVADAKVKSATITGLHLCCGKCVTATETALKTIAGFSSHTATKGAASFTVEGDFSTKELNTALHHAGLHGTIK
jgi:copper chaperone CopZ